MKLETRNLAVKYRPRVLEDYVGQEHIVEELKGMFARGRMPSSILLAGPTGTGKTTLARILARYVNCTNPDKETHAPCGECANCKMVEHPDVMELNAADSRGIDDIRNLLTVAKNSPMMGEKKVIVLDEAQMLTSQAQQCFRLGTLVHTPSGLRPIEDLKEGDDVFSICLSTGEKVSSVVEATKRSSPAVPCVRVYISDTEYIDCTEDHPFWSATRNTWVAARDLTDDDVLLVVPIPLIPEVIDIQVSDNHNFLVGSSGVLVHNCLLKGLEEPSSSTIWIISSMSHEKLLPAIAGRCSKMVLKTVPYEAMSSRLRRISRKEGLDFKKLKDGDKVMKILCDLSCGHMRNAIELLDKAISYSRVTDKVSTEALMELYLQSPEAQHEETAAVILAAILEGNQKAMLTAFYKSTVYRELLYKMRFLSDCILQVATGTARFTPSIMRIFKSKYSGKISLSRMLQVQMMLAELEFRMNSISIDERILMTAFIGDFIATHTTKD